MIVYIISLYASGFALAKQLSGVLESVYRPCQVFLLFFMAESFSYPAAAAKINNFLSPRPQTIFLQGAAANMANISSSLFAAEIKRGGGCWINIFLFCQKNLQVLFTNTL
jgi:hypothetical protein